MNAPDTTTPPPVRELFVAALKLAAGPERDAWLTQACGRDADLRARVQSLLDHHRDDDFLSQPAVVVPASAPTLAATEKPGDRIGRYKLIEQIGEGGCGVVYLAEQEEPVRRRVALKLIKPGMDTRSVLARFEAERQALAMMDHPNIARILDGGATGQGSEVSSQQSAFGTAAGLTSDRCPLTSAPGRPYFVMELVRGVRITEYCDENSLSAPDRLALFVQVCQAVQHAHQKGIIHRDLKPSNILVTVNDGVPVPKVIDFGIAKAVEQKLTDETLVTRFFEFLGTPAYMSPEQAVLTSLDIDTRSDLYSLGVLLYELLTGRTPFDGKELLKAGLDEMRRTIREQEPARPSARVQTLTAAEQTTTAQRRRSDAPKLIHLLSGDLDWIVMKSLEKDRARRYDTASALAADIQRHLANEPVEARPPSRIYRLQKLVRRNRGPLTAAAAVFIVLATGLAASAWLYIREAAARQAVEMHQGDEASRGGRWREALQHWDAAERAGYRDAIDLGLKRAEAWIILQERTKARAEFNQLLSAPELGSSRRKEAHSSQEGGQSLLTSAATDRANAVLLRVGEFEMFERATFTQGIQRVRLALTNGLNDADQWLARGLLAESTPAALAAFRQALRFNPSFPAAHRHSLGLEFVLGRHEDFTNHLEMLRVLQPGEFSPGFLEAAHLALQGRLEDALADLAALTNKLSHTALADWEKSLRFLALAANTYETDNYLTDSKAVRDARRALTPGAAGLFLGKESTNGPLSGLPSLPCVRQGIKTGFEGVAALMSSAPGSREAAMEKIREGWRRHPEAMIPFMAGAYLASQHSLDGSHSPDILALQIELYQMAAVSRSVIPNFDRIARLQAVDVQGELSTNRHAQAAWARAACLTNLQSALAGEMKSPLECRLYFNVARQLGELDLARGFLNRWEQLKPGDDGAARNRIRLEIASGAYGPALKLIDRALAGNPADKFATNARQRALEEIKKLSNESIGDGPGRR